MKRTLRRHARWTPVLAAAAVLLPTLPVHAAGDELDEKGAGALCARYEGFKLPKEALATEADRKLFASESFCADYVYQVVGDEKDYDKARRCCLVKGDCNRELGILFANGWGVRRDYDAATCFLCRAGGEMAAYEQQQMLARVQAMRKEKEPADLAYCDYVTSGAGQLFCERLAASRAGQETDARIAAVRKTLAGEALRKLEALERAAEAFAEEDGALRAEGSRGGTAHPAEVLSGQGEATREFVETLERLAKKRAPAVAAGGLEALDRELNAAFRKARASAGPCPTCEASDASGRETLRDAQRAWIAYRDAWAAFYAERWKGAAPPDVLKRELLADLTRERTARLRQVASGE